MDKSIYRLNRSHAGVCVEKVGNNYKVNRNEEFPIVSVREDTLVVEMRQDKPLILDGEIMSPSGRFFITAETIDPFHIIMDIFNLDILSFVGYSSNS